MKTMVQRGLLSLLAIFTVCSFSFFLIHLVPGDPVDLILGDQASALDREKLRESLGLDQSLWKQYKGFFLKLLKGDLSFSLHSGEPVLTELKQALPATFQLAFFALFLAIMWGVSAGIFSVLKRGLWDTGLSLLSLLAMSLPVFFLAPILIWLFALQLSWLPVSEKGDSWFYFILPAVSLALPLGAVLLKMSRAALLEVIEKDYIRTAKAKGLSSLKVNLKHGLKNALVPIVTVVGLQSGALLTGTVIVESIFDWPGLGLLLLEAIQRRDYPLVQGAVLLISVIYVLVNLIVDLIYIYIHPKMRT
ncbi:MAG: ABC transporter permease [Bdellovibrionales bacterium]|nr:ABC transporter permease [Bdellovibrionales bacterium]